MINSEEARNILGNWGDPSACVLPGRWQGADTRPWPDELAKGDDPAALPGVDSSIHNALDRLAQLSPRDHEKSRWIELGSAVPLDPGLDQNLKISEAELRLAQDLTHLRLVCDKPRQHLRTDERREPVTRVRRITPRSIAQLAARSQDWHARTFRGVQPARLLAQITEDDWAIYENRAVVTLQRHLVSKLSRRYGELKNLLRQVETAEQTGDLSHGSRFLRTRLSKLLGDAFQNESIADPLRNLIVRIDGLNRAVRGLAGSELIKEGRGFSPVATPLRATNIFRSDDSYRHVAELWRLWLEPALERPITREEWLEKRRARIVAHQWLACVLTLRALHDMSLTNESDATWSSGCEQPLGLKRGWKLNRESSGRLILEKDGEPRAQIVPLAGSLCALPAKTVKYLETQLAGPSTIPTLCLWLDGGDVTSRHLRVDGTSVFHRGHHADISPLRLDSGEPVLRFLREIIYREEWPVMPMRPQWMQDIREEANRWGLIKSDGTLISPPEPDILERLKGEAGKKQAEAERLRNAVNECDAEIKNLHRSRKTTHEAKTRKQQTRERAEEADRRSKLLGNLALKLDEVAEVFKFSQECPCCPESQPAEIVSSVRFRCVGCATEWGRRLDGEGIFIRPKNSEDGISSHEDAWGADLIAPSRSR